MRLKSFRPAKTILPLIFLTFFAKGAISQSYTVDSRVKDPKEQYVFSSPILVDDILKKGNAVPINFDGSNSKTVIDNANLEWVDGYSLDRGEPKSICVKDSRNSDYEYPYEYIDYDGNDTVDMFVNRPLRRIYTYTFDTEGRAINDSWVFYDEYKANHLEKTVSSLKKGTSFEDLDFGKFKNGVMTSYSYDERGNLTSLSEVSMDWYFDSDPDTTSYTFDYHLEGPVKKTVVDMDGDYQLIKEYDLSGNMVDYLMVEPDEKK